METRVSSVMFSLDAVSKPLLESIRVGLRYEQVIGNILALRNLKTELEISFPSFVFNFVMMDRNIHEAPAFVHMAKALGAHMIDFRHMVIGNTVDHGKLLEDQPAKYNYFREQIVTEARKLGVDYYLPSALPTNEIWVPAENVDVDLAEFNRLTPDPIDGHRPSLTSAPVVLKESINDPLVAEEFGSTFCPRPFSEVMLRDQDEVLPCPWHMKPLGYLRDGKSLSEIFFGDEFARVRRNMLKPEGDPNCARCPIKSGHLPVDSNS
jgi:MoaA/NifB/PqqE/SkfB family radical SAM enzyme